MSLSNPNLPFIGQIVDYYPTNKDRRAAIVVEVHETDDFTGRPAINLQVLHPNGKMEFLEEVPPVVDERTDTVEPAKCWGFSHEFFIEIEETKPSYLGTKSNSHVGEVGIGF